MRLTVVRGQNSSRPTTAIPEIMCAADPETAVVNRRSARFVLLFLILFVPLATRAGTCENTMGTPPHSQPSKLGESISHCLEPVSTAQTIFSSATTTYTLTANSGANDTTDTGSVAVATAPKIQIDSSFHGSLLNNGDVITNTISVTNGSAGKRIRLALINHGADEFSPPLLVAAQAALASTPSLSVTQSGANAVEFTLADGSYTIPITQTVTLGDIWGVTDDAPWAGGYQLQADWILQESATNGAPVDIGHNIISRWITYASPLLPRAPVAADARWSILRSIPNMGTGGTVAFSIDQTGYPHISPVSVRIGIDSASTADEADFTQTLDAAITSNLTAGITYDASTKTLSFDARAIFPFTFNMTARAVNAYKDFILRISSSSIGEIDVGKAGVRLGKLALPRTAPVLGITLASGEFGEGVPNINFKYPGNDRIDWVASERFGIVRVPFSYRNIQVSSSKNLDQGRMAEIDRIVKRCSVMHLICLLDMHNYGYYYNSSTVFGESPLGTIYSPNSAFADLWAKIAARYKNYPNVWFGLMNEPHAQSALEWVKTANAATAAIRSTGATNKIVFQGSYWDGAWKWQSTDNHIQMLKAYDPADNYAFDAHQYLDSDGSGTHPECTVGSGTTRLKPFTTWLQTYDLYGIIGEVGWAANKGCQGEAVALLNSWADAKTSTSGGGYIALTYWAAGPWWPNDYMYLAEPRPFPSGSDPAQLTTLKGYLPH